MHRSKHMDNDFRTRFGYTEYMVIIIFIGAVRDRRNIIHAVKFALNLSWPSATVITLYNYDVSSGIFPISPPTVPARQPLCSSNYRTDTLKPTRSLPLSEVIKAGACLFLFIYFFYFFLPLVHPFWYNSGGADKLWKTPLDVIYIILCVTDPIYYITTAVLYCTHMPHAIP